MLTNIVFVLTALSAPVAALAPRAADACSAIPQCPDEDGCTATTGNGAKFQLHCSTDFSGPSIATTQGGTFLDCSNACSTRTGCKAFNLKDDFCYHLGANYGAARPGDDAVGGVMTKEPSITPLVGTNSCGDNIDCAAASTDGCAFTSNGKIYIAHCEMDFYGNDFAVTQTNEFTACVTYCANTGGCQGVSWVSGTCYLKSCIAQGSYNPAVKAAYVQQ